MEKMGFEIGQGLGKFGQGIKEPVLVDIKRNKRCAHIFVYYFRLCSLLCYIICTFVVEKMVKDQFRVQKWTKIYFSTQNLNIIIF
jgi:p-aminobenzoyl-glutamate transporter AbgT